MTFECHYCPATFRDLSGLIEHFEGKHRNKRIYTSRPEYSVIEIKDKTARIKE